jgi:hypothetical protein
MDQLFEGVERLPLPYAVFYGLLGLLAFAAQTLAKWADGSYAVGQLNAFHFFNSFNFALGLGLLHYLRSAVQRRFEKFRPYLLVGEAEAEQERYRLTTAPLGYSLIFSLLGLSWALVQLRIAPAPPESLLFNSPVSYAVDLSIYLVFWWTLGGFFHWLIHYFRSSSRLYGRCQADLFHPQGLYIFFTLSLRLAIVATLLNYAWVFFSPQGSLQMGDYITTILVEVVVLASFIWPGWGVHQMLLREKRRLHDQIHSRIEQVVTQLYLEIDLGSYAQMDPLYKALLALQSEHALLDRTSTWPWPIESPRLLATATVVPLLLWLIQRVLERVMR